MAEEGHSKPAAEVSPEDIQPQVKAEAAASGGGDGDGVDGTLIASGEVTYNGKSHQLLLMQKGLRLVPSSQAGSNTEGEAANMPVLDVPWREVVCACEPPVKKSKSFPKAGAGGGGEGDAASKAFVLHYMVRNSKTFKVQCKSIALDSILESAEGWIVQINEKCKEGKPQKLLVIVNPIGGHGNARKLLQSKVQPLFALAEVELVVKVTERAKHAIEMIKTFDVASVDGVIAMGGDGMYMEVLHALTVRKQEEEGVDYNNPEATLVPPSVRVGIIPAGSGNGMSRLVNGVVDLETAVLNIIRGEINRTNIFGVYEGAKLACYAGLFIANGFFSSMIKRSEELRWMRKMRYLYVFMSHMFGKKKVIDLDIEVLKTEPEQLGKDEDAKTECAKGAEASGWSKLKVEQLTSAMAFPARMTDAKENSFVWNIFSSGFDAMFFDSRGSTMDNLRYMYALFTLNKSGVEQPFIVWEKNIRAIRFALVQPPTEGATGSAEQTELTELCKVLDVDGECVYLSEPKYEIRLHSQFLQVFSYGDYITIVQADPSASKTEASPAS